MNNRKIAMDFEMRDTIRDLANAQACYRSLNSIESLVEFLDQLSNLEGLIGERLDAERDYTSFTKPEQATLDFIVKEYSHEWYW